MQKKLALLLILYLLFCFQGLLPYYDVASKGTEKNYLNLPGDTGDACKDVPGSRENNLQDNLIRIHVIANSNSLEDQYIKFAVRDYIIREGKRYFIRIDEITEARKVLRENLTILETAVNYFLQKKGVSYRATLYTGIFDFPEKKYGELLVPAGRYYALRVILGSGKGRNWWCILFPPLCFAGSIKSMEHKVPGELSEIKYFLMGNQQVKIKFESRLIKLWNWIKNLDWLLPKLQ